MILIGSRALSLISTKLDINLLFRKPKDFDFVCTKEEYDTWVNNNLNKINYTKMYAQGNKMIIEGNSICEFEIIQPGTSSEMLADLVAQDSIMETSFGLVPNLDMLFTIKSSHKYLKNSPHFWKTLFDYHVMKTVGAKVRPEYKEFLKLREKETYNYLHPKLNQGKETFFADDAITYFYDHDSIHQSVALHDRPAYTFYMKEGEQVMSDKEKFFACPRNIQLAGVIEEAAVLAIERSLVPHPGVKSPLDAWRFALSKVCSSITSGWFRAFAYDNALEILKMYPENYWNKFQADVDSGMVKPYSGSTY